MINRIFSVVYGSKRQIDCDVNAFRSQKDVFDWDMYTLKLAENEKKPKKKMTYAKSLTQKNLYSSHLFDEEKPNQTNEGFPRKNKNQYRQSSDIFHLSNNPNEQLIRNKGIVRLNKNKETIEQGDQPIMKKSIGNQISKDNTLFKPYNQ